jgi:outer membrane protein assembly factor BamB
LAKEVLNMFRFLMHFRFTATHHRLVVAMVLAFTLVMMNANARGADWPLLRCDQFNTAYSPGPTPAADEIQIAWSMPGYLWWANMAATEGVLFCGGTSGVAAVDALTGAPLWDGVIDTPGGNTGAGPAVGYGKVFWGRAGDDNYRLKRLYALNQDSGEELWTFRLRGEISGCPMVCDDKVFVGDTASRMYCVEASTGGSLWTFRADDWCVHGSPAVYDGMVFFGTGHWTDGKGYVYAVREDTGALIWELDTPARNIGTIAVSDSALYGSVLYVPVSEFIGAVWALDPYTGTVFWQRTFGYNTEVAVAYDKVYVRNADNGHPDILWALDKETGETIWSFEGDVWGGQTPVVGDGKVFWPSRSNLYVLSAETGQLLWSYAGSFWGHGPILAYGMLYVWDYDETTGGEIVAFSIDAPNSPPDEPSDPSPEDGATGVGLDVDLSVYVSDPDDDDSDVSFYVDVSFYDENDALIGTDYAVPSGTRASVRWEGLSADTTYGWYAVAGDSEASAQSATWYFTTAPPRPPDAPCAPSPADGATAAGPDVNLSAYVSDPDGDNMDVSFYEFRDEEPDICIGTVHAVQGGTRASVLWPGLSPDTTYGWYAVADDSEASTQSDTWYFTTEAAPPENVMHVAAIDMWYTRQGSRYTVYTGVTVVDAGGMGVEGATVNIEMALPDGGTVNTSGSTGPDGSVTLQYGPTRVGGTYTSTVTAVTKEGWIYDYEQNVQTTETLTVP